MKEASFFVFFFFYQDQNIESRIFLLKAPYFFLKRDLFLRENSFYLPYFHADVRVVFSSL